MRVSILVAVVLLLGTESAVARDLNGNYAVFGAGGGPCSDYLQARKRRGEHERAYVEWIAGHVSAYNLLLDRTYNVLGKVTAFELLERLDAACRAEPTRPFVQALARELETTYEHRQNLSPNQESGWKNWLEEMADERKKKLTPGK